MTTWTDPYRTGWTKAPPRMLDGQTEQEFDKILYDFFREQNEIAAAKRAANRGEIIRDDERDHGSIRKTSRNRRWLNTAYENYETSL